MEQNRAQYSREGNVLKVSGSLDHSEEEALRCNGEQMGDEASGEVVLDLSGVTYIASACLGTILLLRDYMGKHGISLRLRLPRSLLYVCDLMGIRNAVQTEVVD